MATPSLQSLERGLAALSAINRQPGSGIDALSSELGLSRGTGSRLLETLRREGYVRRGVRGRYVAGERAQALSDGRSALAWLTEDAQVILNDLSARLKWSTLVAAPEDTDMIVRASTDLDSPFVKAPVAPGASYLSIHQAPCGRAYLAHCAERQQAAMLRRLQTIPDARKRLAADEVAATVKMLDRIRADGFTVHDNPTAEVTIAVPIFRAGRVVAGLSIRYFSSVMPVAVACTRYLGALHDAAEAIGRGGLSAPKARRA